MSIVTALKHGGRVYMGADTQITADNRRWNPVTESEYKIKVFTGGLLVGSVGNVSIIRRLMCREDIFNVPSGSFCKKYIVTQMIPAIFSFLESGKLLKEGEDEDGEEIDCNMDCELVLARGDKIFKITDNFAVVEITRYCAIGAGEYYALPYLSDFVGVDAEGCITQAMRCAAKHVNSVSAPYIVIDSVNAAFKVKEE